MTINGLRNTIRYDEDVFRWALAVLDIKNIRKAMPRNRMRIIRSLHFIILGSNIFIAWLILKIAISGFHLIDLVMTTLFVTGVLLLEIPYKNMTASLICMFVGSCFSTRELAEKTLLQLGTRLEEGFSTPAVITTISGWKKNLQIALMAGYLTATCVLLFNFSIKLIFLLAGAWAVRGLSRSTLLTRCL